MASCTFPGIQFTNRCIGVPLSCCELKMVTGRRKQVFVVLSIGVQVSAAIKHGDFDVEAEPSR